MYGRLSSHGGSLHAAFKEMCRFKYDKVYTDVFPQLTKKFNEISSTVQAYEKQLVQLNQTEMAATVRTIQEHERSKLQTTLKLHALRKDYSFRALAFQHSSPDDWSVVEDEGVLLLILCSRRVFDLFSSHCYSLVSCALF